MRNRKELAARAAAGDRDIEHPQNGIERERDEHEHDRVDDQRLEIFFHDARPAFMRLVARVISQSKPKIKTAYAAA